MNIFYEYGENLYVNLTNECPMDCTFCERQFTDKIGQADSLWLDHEPTMIEVMTALSKWNMMNYKEMVFCGFGEPTERIDMVLDVARLTKKHSNIKIRLNTNGLGNLINQRDIVPSFKDVIDIVSISLNAASPETYLRVTRSEYGIDSFKAMLEFAAECKDVVGQVIMTTVEKTITTEEEEKCAEICRQLGVEYHIRPYEDHGSGVFPNPEGGNILPEGYEGPAVGSLDEAAATVESPAEESVSEASDYEAAQSESPSAEPETAEVEEEPVAPQEETSYAAPEAEPTPIPETKVSETPVSEAPAQRTPVMRPRREESRAGREIMLYLASASPRRKELISQLGINYEAIESNVTENTEGKTPGEAAQAIALAKAQAVADQVPGPAVIVAADTLISLHGDIYGKPSSEDDAFEMLSALQGGQHRVYTGVAIIVKARVGQKSETFSDFTKVKMVEMSEKEIKDYIATGEPMDKAGAYAIQGIGARYIESIEGNYTTVVGLPMHILYSKLKGIRGLFPTR